MKLRNTILGIAATAALVLPVALPSTAFAQDFGPATQVNSNGISTDSLLGDSVNHSYSSFTNGKEVVTKSSYDENYQPNTSKIQKYLEGYINDFRAINGLQAINWDQNQEIVTFTNARLAKFQQLDGPDRHAGFNPLFDEQQPSVFMTEALSAKLSGVYSDKEYAYYLFYCWYTEIGNKNEEQMQHLQYMLENSTDGSARVATDSDGNVYAIINTSENNGKLNVFKAKRMPTYTFLYE